MTGLFFTVYGNPAPAIASVRPHVAEVCVFDTGSTDGTRYSIPPGGESSA